MEKSKGKKYRFYINFLTITLIILCLLFCVCDICINSAFAVTEIYSNVVFDLQKDENFNVYNYQYIENDNSLKLIQIAESIDNELLIYVYHPSGYSKNLQATSISISTTVDDISPNLYTLTLLSFDGVFAKYKVNNFIVSKEETRIYEIVSIFRKWLEGVDEPADGNNTISEVSFQIGKHYEIKGFGENISYKCEDFETIRVTDKYVGFVRYTGGYQWDGVTYASCDNHFVAFSTDHDIDLLLEADVYYVDRSYHYLYAPNSMVELIDPSIEYGEKVEHKVTLNHDDEEYYQGNIFHTRYKWNKIQSVTDFIAGENYEDVYHVVFVDVRRETSLTNEGLSNIQNKQWVLRFASTDYLYKHRDWDVLPEFEEIKSTQIMDVSILRLKFKSKGETFNLGVVDNKQTGDGKPDNETKITIEIAQWLKDFLKWLKNFWWLFLLIVFFLILIIVLIVVFFKEIFSFIGNLILKILQGIWGLIKLPFTLFKRKK